MDRDDLVTAGLEHVARAVVDIAAGRAVVVCGEGPAAEGCLVVAAAQATQAVVAFLVRHGSGYLQVAVTDEECDRLDLPPMWRGNRRGTGATVTVDARRGISTGISASDRARTLRLLADPGTTAADLTRPGHVAPLRVGPAGVLRRAGHPEAASDLARLAGLPPVGVLCEIVSTAAPEGLAHGEELVSFAAEHGLARITIAELIDHRRRIERQVVRVVEARIPTARGTFRALGYDCGADGAEHLAMVLGELDGGSDVLVAVHVECITGDVLGSLHCECGPRLDAALGAVAAEGRGVVVYLRRPGGSGGLLDALRGYQRRDAGGGLAAGPRVGDHDDALVAEILDDLGVSSVRPIGHFPTVRARLHAG